MTKEEWITNKLNYLNEYLVNDIKAVAEGKWLMFGLPKIGDIKENEIVQCLKADVVTHPLNPVFLIKGDYYRFIGETTPEIYESAFYEDEDEESEVDYKVIGYRDTEITIELNEKIQGQTLIKRKREVFGNIENVVFVFDGEQWIFKS